MTQLGESADLWLPGKCLSIRHVMRQLRREYREQIPFHTLTWVDMLPEEFRPQALRWLARLDAYTRTMLGLVLIISTNDPDIAPLFPLPRKATAVAKIVSEKYPAAACLVVAHYRKMPVPELMELIVRSQFSHPLDELRASMVEYGLIEPSPVPARDRLAPEIAPYCLENIP